jgi:hypothetical protein
MYTHIWQKYLPVIKILFKKSAAAEQKLGLNRTDFEKGSRSGKPSCSFSISVEKGRLSTANPPASARELIALLQEDATVKILLKQNHYKISLNTDLQLRILNISPEEKIAADQPLREQV